MSKIYILIQKKSEILDKLLKILNFFHKIKKKEGKDKGKLSSVDDLVVLNR